MPTVTRVAAALAVAVALIAGVLPGRAPISEAATSATASTLESVRYTANSRSVRGDLQRLGDPLQSVAWVTRGPIVGSWVRWTPQRPTAVDTVRVASASRADRLTRATIRFSDGSRIHVKANGDGDAVVRFTSRKVRWAKLVLTGTASRDQQRIALSRWSLSQSSEPLDQAQRVLPTATSDRGAEIAAVVDAWGRTPARTGDAWMSDSTGTVRVSLTWPVQVRVSSLQLFGSPLAAGAVASGRIRFPSGETIALLPIAAGDAQPTTIAFPTHRVRSLTLELTPRSGDRVRLREIAALGPGVPTNTGATKGGVKSTIRRAASCAGVTARPSSTLRLVCPATGTGVRGVVWVVVSAPAGTPVNATAVLRSGATATVATAVAVRGTAALRIDTGRLQGGPVVVRVTAPDVRDPLYLQLVNRSHAVKSIPVARRLYGKTLVLDEDFTDPLSLSATGAGARYAATKSASWGNSEFGGAVFSDPARNPQNVSAVGGQYLRIRLTPLKAVERDPNGWSRTSRGGIVSSASVAGGGFAAQYGYFEARILAPAAPGTWPAFWLMSSGFLENSQTGRNSEIDTVELYGHDPSHTCHSWHDWVGVADQRRGKVDCVHRPPDWAMTWHTYGVDVSRSGTRFFIDGEQVSSAPAVAEADDPFYFMLDLSLGAGWPIDLSGMNGVADLYVDFVRVYV